MKLLIDKVLEVLSENVSNIFDIKLDKNDLQNSTKKEFGDFQSNFAMSKSKVIGKNPRVIAEELISKFDGKDIISKIEVAGPGFINIFVTDSILNEETAKLINEKYEYNVANDETVIIDYSSPNIAKRMHVGHLRSTIIGDALKRIYKELGFRVLGDNHIGDWGTQFGKLIVAYNKWLDKEAYNTSAIEELERLYVKFSGEAKINSELEEEARFELKKVQSGDPVNLALWKEFITYSLKEYDKVYKRLGIEFELINGESFYNDMMPKVLEKLKEKGLAREDQGALVVFFENDELPPCIVQKKDNSFLYSTSDLATIIYRKDELNIDRAIYVVDERQQGHFKQVFKISEMLGSPYDYKKHHTQFGIMRFADGTIFSTRGGDVIRLEEILDVAHKEVRKIVDEKNPTLSDEEKENIAEVVGVGAIKYFDLSQNRATGITFDWSKVLSFEGNTGPYLQYCYVRIMSILRKAKSQGIEKGNKYLVEGSTDSERNLLVTLHKLGYTVIKAFESNRPNLIAEYLFDLTKEFNSFYTSNQVIDVNNIELTQARLAICEKTAEVIKKGLSLLGIDTVERM
ncbi:arginine--tRNA ligase [Pseudostreptobacillus hongkongensis]|uniref:arginine--tRNA ligase n=1 Tax=Pseudostreptobacillus hongkongensis TaxID=1162717 RepID=UPI00082FF92A|nr:arginine--tRNA ligase [Pseudostreptobacillus hongkongensis]